MTPLPMPEAGARVDLRGTLVAVHFRDERGFAIFSLEQADGTRIRALGDLPSDMTLGAVVRIGGIWIRHAQYGWQVRVNTFELIDHLDRRGVVAFLVAYTTHLGPVRAAEAVERFGDRVFEVLHNSPEDLCVIKGITPDRAWVIRETLVVDVVVGAVLRGKREPYTARDRVPGRRAGPTRTSPECASARFRHDTARRLVESVDLPTVAAWLGHERLDTIRIYSQPDEAALVRGSCAGATLTDMHRLDCHCRRPGDAPPRVEVVHSIGHVGASAIETMHVVMSHQRDLFPSAA